MSYDLRVWGRRPVNLADHLKPADGWLSCDGVWTLEKRSWQISVSAIQDLESEDVPTTISATIPGVSTLVELSLEPATPPAAALKALRSTARALAEAVAGVIEDPREEGPARPRGQQRYAKPEREERFDALELHWWYLNSPLRNVAGRTGEADAAKPDARGLAELLRILGTHVSEALPRRYGRWEPPQHKTEATGLGALTAFLQHNLDDSVILEPTRPVLSLHISDSEGLRNPRLGFRSQHLSLTVEKSALEQPGWECALRRLWRELSSFLRPFYGEARVT